MEQRDSRHAQRLADMLDSVSRRGFVGRSAELATFDALLLQPERVSVLWLAGPGGVGKTALMQACAGRARDAGWPTARIDGYTRASTPPAFAAAVEASVSAGRSESGVGSTSGSRLVVFIDTYERLDPLDDWLREQYLPSLPVQTLIMVARRQLPSVGWRTDPGWASVLQVLPLRNFRPEESRTYLTSRRIPDVHRDEILSFTHGNPLALSLIADLYRLQPERFTVEHPDGTKSEHPTPGGDTTCIRDGFGYCLAYRRLGSTSPQSSAAEVSEVRNHDQPGPSRPVLPVR